MRTQIIQLAIPGEPQGKQRPRATIVGKGAKRFVRAYTPEKTVNYETYIKELFAVKYPDFIPVECVLELELIAWLMIPISTSQKRKALMESGDLRPGKQPDVDNVLKSVMDALEKLAYKNDAQIVTAYLHKFYAHKPRLDINIFEVK